MFPSMWWSSSLSSSFCALDWVVMSSCHLLVLLLVVLTRVFLHWVPLLPPLVVLTRVLLHRVPLLPPLVVLTCFVLCRVPLLPPLVVRTCFVLRHVPLLSSIVALWFYASSTTSIIFFLYPNGISTSHSLCLCILCSSQCSWISMWIHDVNHNNYW